MELERGWQIDCKRAGAHVTTVFTSAPADMSNWHTSMLDLKRK